MINGCLDKNSISTKIKDGGHFIPFAQNICRRGQDRKKRLIEIFIYTR
jgi:hypothetical protein